MAMVQSVRPRRQSATKPIIAPTQVIPAVTMRPCCTRWRPKLDPCRREVTVELSVEPTCPAEPKTLDRWFDQ